AYPEAQELWHQVKRIKQLDQIIECLHTTYSEKS
ncbi:MAG: tRNA-dihydrouridine synthase C, partial [Acinetobacter sp.]